MARIHRKTAQKVLNDLDNPDGVITQLEPDILECEVNWALGNISMNKASGGDGIPAELFQIQKDNAVKVLHSICQQIWKTQQYHRTGKGQFSFQSQRKAMPKKMFKLLHNCTYLTRSKVMLKILQARLQQNLNCEFPDVQAGFRKGRVTRDQIANICWIIEKVPDAKN